MTQPSSQSSQPQTDLATRLVDVLARQRRRARLLAATDARARRAKIRRILEWTESNAEAIRRAGWDDFKKPVPEVDLTEIYPVLTEARHALRHLRRWMKPKRVWPTLALLSTRASLRYEPKGVALIISPWNYPFNLTVGPLISAIAAGNAVCLKPSELTPAMAALIRRLAEELFEEDEVAVFEGQAEVASALLALPFDHIFFTGSPRVGKVVMKAAAENLATVTLELGGKSPVIVDTKVDLRDAAQKIALGKWVNCGQTCIAPDYVLVHRSRHDALVQELDSQIKLAYGKSSAERRRSGDYARIVNDSHFARLKNLLDDAARGGATVIGGESESAERYFEPTLVTQLAPDAALLKEEIFGPLLPIVAFDHLDDAIALVRARPKPLALYLFSTERRVIDRLLTELSAGGTCINEVALHFLHPNLPFGGINNSGHGSSHGIFGFRAFSHERAILRHHKWSALKLLAPPYGERARRLIAAIVKYL
jgi:aldehyde dehydrogenase (NAD+)